MLGCDPGTLSLALLMIVPGGLTVHLQGVPSDASPIHRDLLVRSPPGESPPAGA
jgi:hypothetical protein